MHDPNKYRVWYPDGSSSRYLHWYREDAEREAAKVGGTATIAVPGARCIEDDLPLDNAVSV